MSEKLSHCHDQLNPPDEDFVPDPSDYCLDDQITDSLYKSCREILSYCCVIADEVRNDYGTQQEQVTSTNSAEQHDSAQKKQPTTGTRKKQASTRGFINDALEKYLYDNPGVVEDKRYTASRFAEILKTDKKVAKCSASSIKNSAVWKDKIMLKRPHKPKEGRHEDMSQMPDHRSEPVFDDPDYMQENWSENDQE